MSQKIQVAAQFDGYANRKDKTCSLRFITQELKPSEVAHIHGMIDTFGYLYFKGENEMSQVELDELDKLNTDLYDRPKTQSQRIRNTLFILWNQKPEGFTEFKDYYKWKSDRIIQHLKDQIEQ